MHTFKKEERICSKKLLEALFSEGKSMFSFPFRINYLQYPIESSFPAQVVIIVSKKRFKRAHQRNRIKRLIRECYRLQKNELYNYLNNNNLKIAISINYIADVEPEYTQLSIHLELALAKLKPLLIK